MPNSISPLFMFKLIIKTQKDANILEVSYVELAHFRFNPLIKVKKINLYRRLKCKQ